MEHNASARFNPYVHGARGLFCLMVFVYHVVHSGLPTFDLSARGLLGEALHANAQNEGDMRENDAVGVVA